MTTLFAAGTIRKASTTIYSSHFTAASLACGDVVTVHVTAGVFVDSVVITDSMDDEFKGYSIIDGTMYMFAADAVVKVEKGCFASIGEVVSAIKDAGGLR